MSLRVAKEELNSLTEFQRELHVAEGPHDDIVSNNYRKFIKSTWYSTVVEEIPHASTDNKDVTYHPNMDFHLLYYAYLRARLPAIRIRPQYRGKARIAWCHNIGTNLILRAAFMEDNKELQSWDSTWTDINSQFYQSSGAGKRDAHNVGIGNIKCLEEWAEALPAYTVNIDQPWFYSLEPYYAFPLLYKNSQTRVMHQYTFQLEIAKLLRVQILENGKWHDVAKGIHKVVNIKKKDSLKIPELWGRYAYLTDNEVQWWKKCSDKDLPGSKISRSLYIRNVEVCDAINSTTFGKVAEVVLESRHPCLAFFWVAENIDARKNRNYSNYTTNTEDLYSGWDPITDTTLIYGTTVRLDKMASDHFTLAEPRKHFPSAPHERGYHGLSYAYDSTNFDADNAIVLDNHMKAKLQCTLGDNNIFNSLEYDNSLDKDEDDDDGPKIFVEETKKEPKHSPQFLLRVRLLTLRKLSITSDDGSNFLFHLR